MRERGIFSEYHAPRGRVHAGPARRVLLLLLRSVSRGELATRQSTKVVSTKWISEIGACDPDDSRTILTRMVRDHRCIVGATVEAVSCGRGNDIGRFLSSSCHGNSVESFRRLDSMTRNYEFVRSIGELSVASMATRTWTCQRFLTSNSPSNEAVNDLILTCCLMHVARWSFLFFKDVCFLYSWTNCWARA